MILRRGVVTALLFPALAAGCYDLTVPNPNEPTREQALETPGTAEALISSAFADWYASDYDAFGPGLMLSAAAFQHASSFRCQAPYSGIPRLALTGDGGCTWLEGVWFEHYENLYRLADGLRALEAGTAGGDLRPAERDRLRAFGRFMQGLLHGDLALLYDRGFVSDEDSPTIGRELVGYTVMLDTALAFLEEAAALSDGRSWPEIPPDWTTVTIAPDQLARLAHSFAARYRAAVARTPEEREAVDWNAVLADVDRGITATWNVETSVDNLDEFYNWVVTWGTPWSLSQETYFIIGMADQSGAYQRWLGMPLAERVPDPDSDGDGEPDPILIVTPDRRFPAGQTLAEQQSSPGSMYRIPESPQDNWARADRGRWRWSHYWSTDGDALYFGEDLSWPEITLAEMRLLKAEALLRLGNPSAAAALVNISRTAAGLRPTDADGSNPDCVPRLPDGSCGDLMEMLKWEKRLETHFRGLFSAPWFFDGRGWGDLYAGTSLQYSVPCDELELLDLSPCHAFGGVGGEAASVGSVYHWPGEL